jgi:hypothetical protein
LSAVLLAVGGASTLAYVAGKEIFKAILAAKLDAAKSEMAARTEERITRLRVEMEAEAKEREIRYGSLHAKRFLVIEELYKNLVETHAAMLELTSLITHGGTPSEEERAEEAAEAWTKMKRHFLRNRIYLAPGLSTKIADANRKYFTAYRTFVRRNQAPPGPEEEPDAWDRAWKTVTEDAAGILKDIEREFRSILGVATAEESEENTVP